MLPIIIFLITTPDERHFMEQLYTRHHNMMYKTACKYAPSDGIVDADDVVSSVCIALIDKISLLNQLDEKAQEAYIYTATKNTALSFQRKRSADLSHISSTSLLESIPDADNDPLALIIQEHSNTFLSLAIDKLSQTDKSVLQMKYWLGYSPEKIASSLHISKDSLRMYLYRAKLHLAKEMELLRRNDTV